MDQSRLPMFEVLDFYRSNNPTIFHIPGHGGLPPHPSLDPASGLFTADRSSSSSISSLLIDQADESYLAGSPDEQAQALAAELWSARRCWWLLGGASQGNHALLLGLTQPGDVLMAARGSHLSLVSGLVLSGAQVEWIGDGWDESWQVPQPLAVAELEAALQAAPQRPRAVMVTSPTYFGQVADIPALAELCHQAGVGLWIDGSWGSHFGFHPQLPANPLTQGADLLLISTHKHAGSLRGSAMLLAAHSPWLGDEEIDQLQRAVRLLTTTSPSPLLRLSLDAARWQLAERGQQLWGRVLEVADYGRQRLSALAGVQISDSGYAAQEQDHSRIIIDVSSSGWQAQQLSKRLVSDHHVICEMATDRLLVLMLSHSTSHEDIDRLVTALEIELPRAHGQMAALGRLPAVVPTTLSPRQAALGPTRAIELEHCAGMVAAEAIAVYPPGIPALIPGCRISQETVSYLLRARQAGARLHGACDSRSRLVQVVATESDGHA